MAAKKGATTKKAAPSAAVKKAGKKAATEPAKKTAKKALPTKSGPVKGGTKKEAAKKAVPAKGAAKKAVKGGAKKESAKKAPATSTKGGGKSSGGKETGTKKGLSTVNEKPRKSPEKKIVRGTTPAKGVQPANEATKSVAKSKPTTTVTKKQTPEPIAQTPTSATPQPKKTAGKKPKKMSATAIKTAMKNLPATAFSASTGTGTSEPFPKKDLDRFNEMIHSIREENVAELEELSEQLREMAANEGADDNSYSLHMAEQGTDAMEREKTFLQAQRTSDYIKKLDESLMRIQNGTFGICRVCGLRLDSRRLMAVPVTQVCTVYKNSSKPCQPGKYFMEMMSQEEE